MFASERVAPRQALKMVLPFLAIVATWFVAAPAHAAYEITSFTNEAVDAEGHLDTRAGARPYELVTNLDFSTKFVGGAVEPTENLRDLRVDLPVGFVGNSLAMPQCSDERLDEGSCPVASQVGTVEIRQGTGGAEPFLVTSPLFNMVPQPGEPAQLAFTVGLFPVRSHISVRTDGDYGLSYELQNIPQPTAVVGTTIRLWGAPADSRHDLHRGEICFQRNRAEEPFCFAGSDVQGPSTEPHPVDVPLRPFISNATHCGVTGTTRARVDSWQETGVFDSKEIESPAVGGCEELEFNPSLKARPTTNAADSPSGLDVDLKMPQNEAPEGLATPDLRTAQVTLPEGLVVNPSSANGLGACSPAQVGLTTPVGNPDAHFNLAPAACPDASRIGSAESKCRRSPTRSKAASTWRPHIRIRSAACSPSTSWSKAMA